MGRLWVPVTSWFSSASGPYPMSTVALVIEVVLQTGMTLAVWVVHSIIFGTATAIGDGEAGVRYSVLVVVCRRRRRKKSFPL